MVWGGGGGGEGAEEKFNGDTKKKKKKKKKRRRRRRRNKHPNTRVFPKSQNLGCRKAMVPDLPALGKRNASEIVITPAWLGNNRILKSRERA